MKCKQIALQYIKYYLHREKQKTKILAETTNEKAAKNKQTKISHYLEVV